MTEQNGFVVVTTTVDSEDAAKTLARAMVDSKLAACVQYTVIRSIYRWKGSVESAPEYLLVAKTVATLADQLMTFIKENHSYELPEITVTPIRAGLSGYLDWIAAETRGPTE